MRLVSLSLIAVLLAGCSDDTRPPDDAWFESTLPSFSGSAVLFGAIFDGSRGIAVGAEVGPGTSKPILLESFGGSWGQETVNDLPASGVLAGVALTRDGSAIVVGHEGTSSPLPLLLDERGGWHRPALTGSDGGLIGALHAGGDSVWACGSATGGLFYLSTTALNWTRVGAGLSTPDEKGFRDLTFADGVTYACGWDNGEAPYSVILRNSGTGWQVVTHPEPAETELEFDSILVDDEGTLWVGGHVTRVVHQGDVVLIIDSARLYRRPRGGTWSALTLPDPDGLKTISDIVQMSTGTVYFSASGDVRLLLWAANEIREVVLPELDGGLNGLAEAPGGFLYAVGMKLDTMTSKFKPLMLRSRVGL